MGNGVTEGSPPPGSVPPAGASGLAAEQSPGRAPTVPIPMSRLSPCCPLGDIQAGACRQLLAPGQPRGVPQPLPQAVAVPRGCGQPPAAPSAVPIAEPGSLLCPGRVRRAHGCWVPAGATGLTQRGGCWGEGQAALGPPGSTREPGAAVEPQGLGLPGAGSAFLAVISLFFGGRLSPPVKVLLSAPSASPPSWGILWGCCGLVPEAPRHPWGSESRSI